MTVGKYIKIILISFVLLLVFIEVGASMALKYPVVLKNTRLRCVFRDLYSGYYRNIIQFESKSSRYDPVLTYTLRPGLFCFTESEFRNDFYVNSMGLRDDESSLIRPEVIVLGDSLAMGWGVNQDETYAQAVERESGLKVLNAAISSYGTVREMRLLSRIDTSNLKYLVVHYCSNDYDENKYFYDNKKLDISSEKSYNETVRKYKKAKCYYPGKYLRLMLLSVFKKKEAALPGSKAKYFLNALVNASGIFSGNVKIIVISQDDADFAASFKKETMKGGYPDYIKNIIFLDLSNALPADCFYILDDHINTRGHGIIADNIIKIIAVK